MHPMAIDNRRLEGEPRLGTVPINEFVDGVEVPPSRIWT
jgi:hypothetical protein